MITQRGASLVVLLFFSLLFSSHAKQQLSAANEHHHADALATAWGFKSGRPFLRVQGGNASMETVLGKDDSQALVVALLGSEKPRRRSKTTAHNFVNTDSLEPEYAYSLGLSALNRGARAYELATGKQLYSFTLIPVVMQQNSKGPYAVWEVSTGNVFMASWLLERTHGFFGQGGNYTLLSQFAETLFPQMATALEAEGSTESGDVFWKQLVSRALPAALAVAAASQIPVWFCIACPVVLGLLAPFVFNLGFGSAANMICEHYQLPSEECNNLWYGAFALAMVLSVGSAIPIVYVCQLPKCGRQLLQR